MIHNTLSEVERDELVANRMELARRVAWKFWHDGKYPMDFDEIEGEAYLTLVEASREYDEETARLPWGAFLKQRLHWRLNDFIQRWYRLNRRDFVSGQPDARRHVPLDDSALAAGSQPKEPLEHLLEGEAVELADRVLTRRERRLLELRYRDGMNLAEASRILGMTHQRCRQLHCEIIRTLREVLNGTRTVGSLAHRARVG